MKYWNKRKGRHRWVQIGLKRAFDIRSALTGWNEPSIKFWCQQQPSRGKFYIEPYSGKIYFQLKKDATWFILKNPQWLSL